MTDLQRAVLSDVPIPTGPGGTPGLRGVLGVPEGSGPWPGVVLLHETFGVDGVMRRQAQRMAAAGYLALMPDLFTDGGARRRLVPTFRAVAAGEGRPFVDAEAARGLLAARVDCTGRVGVLGFSVGGGLALHLASRGFDAAAVTYARLPADPHGVLLGACPIVASYGGRDPALRGTAAELAAVLTRLGVPHDVREYPDAAHGFLNDAEVGPRALRPVLRRVLRIAPDPVAAADAWTRTRSWFAEHLGDGGRTPPGA
ncbi:dienelactone hydrolase family protein [Modestobacter marinus]|uniref:Carboxymethylenebutenolidase n=1 Tax=Modestobacter marinus TaxID=477641 RepID=A0A846LKB7_9ACTN|nr:dienelactone hydrolase family protein [Modestobacter marinus]NIH66492.1 carboxymethylenebutenolidase [Modestobacter marinus]GGL64068.1 carboxymethylenebutenolidase [Modestobacter marinus]